MQQSTSSDILSILIQEEFKETLSLIVTDEKYVDFIKKYLSYLINMIADKKLSTVIKFLLKKFVMHNKALGDWIISELINKQSELTDGLLLFDLIMSNTEQFLRRIKILKEFIFQNFSAISSEEKPDYGKLNSLKLFMETFTSLVQFYFKNLQVPIWRDQVTLMSSQNLEEAK
mmetsp:Transcript_41238/g.47506  ORF Transcript_41238/g.47506 Transcript_41238/m.47506 type:complete len:173 (+) Transcript_41238:3557-4075(+)